MRRLRWNLPERPVPRHPIRDSALVYGLMAGVIVIVGVATGGAVARTAAIALLFWLAAMAWAWMRWRQRLRGAGRR